MQTQLPPDAIAVVSPALFHNDSKVKRTGIPLQSGAFGEGTTSRYQLPNAGLGSEVWGMIYVPFTVAGTVTGGRFAGTDGTNVSSPISYNPAPWCIIRNLVFSNTGQYLFHQYDGFHWYSTMRDRYAYDPGATNQNAPYSTDVLTNIVGSNAKTSAVKPGVAVVAQAYVIAIPFRLPIAYNHAGDRALIVLGTPNLDYNLDITWGTISNGIGATGGSSDLIKGLTGSGLSVTVGTPYINFELEYYLIPPEFRFGMSDFTDQYLAIQQNQQPINNTGLQTWLAPPLAVYTGVAIHNWNNGSPISSANITQVQWNYSGQSNDIGDDLASLQARQAWMSQIPPIDGKILFDYGVELGLYQKRERYGAFNNQVVTGLNVQWRIANTVSLSSGQSTIVTESLMPFAQSQ